MLRRSYPSWVIEKYLSIGSFKLQRFPDFKFNLKAFWLIACRLFEPVNYLGSSYGAIEITVMCFFLPTGSPYGAVE